MLKLSALKKNMFGNCLNTHISGSPSRVAGEIPFQTIPWQFKHLRVTQIWSSCADFSSCFAFIDLMAKTNFFLCSGCFIPISCNDNHQQFALPLALHLIRHLQKCILCISERYNCQLSEGGWLYRINRYGCLRETVADCYLFHVLRCCS